MLVLDISFVSQSIGIFSHKLPSLKLLCKCSSAAHLGLFRNQHQDASSSSSFPSESYDIVINGGGIVGFSFLTALKTSRFLSKKRILLIEQQSPPKHANVDIDLQDSSKDRIFSNRVSAITNASRQFFKQLDIWSSLEPHSKTVNGMYVWADYYRNSIDFSSSSGETVCHIVENNRILNALHDQLNNNTPESLKVSYGQSVTDIEQRFVNDTLDILLKVKSNNSEEESKTIRTKLLIGCDGFKSLVRTKSTLPYFEHDLQQMGIVGTLQVDSPYKGNNIAFQRFVNSNSAVIALLPLDESHSSLVLAVQKKDYPSWMQLSEDDFIGKLNDELHREPTNLNPIERLTSTIIPSSLGKTSGSSQPPIIKSIVPGSRAAFPLGFGTTIPFLVGSIQSKTPLIQAITKRDNRVNTAIIGM